MERKKTPQQRLSNMATRVYWKAQGRKVMDFLYRVSRRAFWNRKAEQLDRVVLNTLKASSYPIFYPGLLLLGGSLWGIRLVLMADPSMQHLSVVAMLGILSIFILGLRMLSAAYREETFRLSDAKDDGKESEGLTISFVWPAVFGVFSLVSLIRHSEPTIFYGLAWIGTLLACWMVADATMVSLVRTRRNFLRWYRGAPASPPQAADPGPQDDANPA